MGVIKFNVGIASIAILFGGFIAGCGGGGSSGSNGGSSSGVSSIGTNPEPTGIFVDSPVTGLSYQQGSQSGHTDEYGVFTYDPSGGQIEFYVGAYKIGEATPGARITPGDLSIDGQPVDEVSVAQFLQSLDDDQDPENGIDVSAADASLDSIRVPLDFTAPAATFETSLTDLLSTEGLGTPVDRAAAENHLRSGTAQNFATSSVANHVFYYQIAGTTNRNDRGLIGFQSNGHGFLNPMSDFQRYGGNGIGDNDQNFDWWLEEGELHLEWESDERSVIRRLSSVSVDGALRFTATYHTEDAAPVIVHMTRNVAPNAPARYYLRGIDGSRSLRIPSTDPDCPNCDAGFYPCVNVSGNVMNGYYIESMELNSLARTAAPRGDNPVLTDPPAGYMIRFGGRQEGYNYMVTDNFFHDDRVGWGDYFWARLDPTSDTSCQ